MEPPATHAPSRPSSVARIRLRVLQLQGKVRRFFRASVYTGGNEALLARRKGECTRCGLSEERTQIVFGDGNPGADLLFIGEGPGEQEDLRGLPFVGRAGELLTRMIEKGLGIPRSQVYICNIVKCRPPGNRTPQAREVAACRPFLDGQIDDAWVLGPTWPGKPCGQQQCRNDDAHVSFLEPDQGSQQMGAVTSG